MNLHAEPDRQENRLEGLIFLVYSGSQKSEVCPMPYALCPMPYALCPMPMSTSSFARKAIYV